MKTPLYIGVLLLLASAALHSLGAIRLNTNLQAGDQGAYLHLTLAQKEGLALTDGNRHPLHSALLLPLADRSPEFFARARWVSLIIGMALLSAIAWTEYKTRIDPLSAFFVLAFLAVHVQMVRTNSEIWCEPTLYLLVYLLWMALDRGSRGETAGLFRWDSSLFHLLGGGLAGLAYLAKGTGLQAAVFFLVALFIFSKNKIKPLLAVGMFLLVSAPLLVWNSVVYKSPLYSFASTHNMWFDEADEIWYDDPADLPTLGSYLETHTFGEILGRLGRGLILESKMAFRILVADWRLPAGSGPLAEGLFLLFKVLLVLGVGWGVWRWWRGGSNQPPLISRAALVYFLLFFAFLFPSFGWYAQLTDEPRFLMTIAPIAVVLAGRLFSLGVGGLLQPGTGREKVIVGMLIAYSLFVLSQTAAFAWKTRLVPPPALDPLAGKILEEIDRLPESAKIAFGPSHGLPIWLARPDLEWRPTPWRIDLDRFHRMLEREGIGFVLLDGETLARRPYLAPLVGPEASRELGWPIRARFRGEGGFFILYEVATPTG